MPFVIYLFAVNAFAFGLAEFLPIGLTSAIASSLQISPDRAGLTVTAYAIGATFSAPILTALTASWSRKRVMLTTAIIFSLGSLMTAGTANLTLLLSGRFIAGLGHGLFLAVASSTAAQLVGPAKAGRAVAVVFGGFTLAMAVGVPTGTWLAGFITWRPVMGAIAIFGAIGFLGLMTKMKDPLRAGTTTSSGGLKALAHRKLLSGTLVTVLAYSGSFTAFTYIAPLLMSVTRVSSATVSLFMFVYGIMAVTGNAAGGRLTDRLGIKRANILIIGAIIPVLAGMWLLADSAIGMGILIALLGMLTFATVPALQARLLDMARQEAPEVHGVAAGLNIAGFNFGIALGSAVGGFTLAKFDVGGVGLSGAILSLLGLALLVWQMRRSHRVAALNADGRYTDRHS